MESESSFPRSLPFKKRRLLAAAASCVESTASTFGVPMDHSSYPLVPPPSTEQEEEEDSPEKIAALALVAAATATVPLVRAVTDIVEASSDSTVSTAANDSRSTPTPWENDSLAQQLRAPPLQQDRRPLPQVSPLTSSLQQACATTTSNSRPTPHVVLPTGAVPPRQRIHHPPLLAPLPNGCHGRTSRNNSYCRRQPCYNGSQYCKLHYQQYIVAGHPPPAARPPAPHMVRALHPPPRAVGANFQDKRYTGYENEVRCRATTTRGRACAYVAVNETPFCNLHAEYETNPPPRRGGCPPLCGVGVATPPPPPPSTHESSSQGDSSTTPSHWVTPASSGGVAKNTPLPRRPHPLLSTISSDQWLNKKVLLTAGPLVNRQGRVVKWGNGWVSVRILTDSPGDRQHDLLHNRRSIELLMLPENDPPPQQQEQDDNIPGPPSDSLMRCVSTELDPPAAALAAALPPAPPSSSLARTSSASGSVSQPSSQVVLPQPPTAATEEEAIPSALLCTEEITETTCEDSMNESKTPNVATAVAAPVKQESSTESKTPDVATVVAAPVKQESLPGPTVVPEVSASSSHNLIETSAAKEVSPSPLVVVVETDRRSSTGLTESLPHPPRSGLDLLVVGTAAMEEGEAHRRCEDLLLSSKKVDAAEPTRTEKASAPLAPTASCALDGDSSARKSPVPSSSPTTTRPPDGLESIPTEAAAP